MRFSNYTIKGSRKINEDSFRVWEFRNLIFACVADGVGGLPHGDFASNFVVSKFEEYCRSNETPDLNNFILTVNINLIDIAKHKFNVEKIATTFSGAVISDKLIKGIHIGDSRICVLRGNGIKQITNDQTEVARLIREGRIEFEDRKFYSRKSRIESILGDAEAPTNSQNIFFELMPNDRILFSTDGFHDVITKTEIRDLSIKYKSLEEFKRALVIELENRILSDNATFVCIEI